MSTGIGGLPGGSLGASTQLANNDRYYLPFRLRRQPAGVRCDEVVFPRRPSPAAGAPNGPSLVYCFAGSEPLGGAAAPCAVGSGCGCGLSERVLRKAMT